MIILLQLVASFLTQGKNFPQTKQVFSQFILLTTNRFRLKKGRLIILYYEVTCKLLLPSCTYGFHTSREGIAFTRHHCFDKSNRVVIQDEKRGHLASISSIPTSIAIRLP